MKKKSLEAEIASKTEFQNKKRCMEFEQSVQREMMDCSQLTIAVPKRSGTNTMTSMQSGEYVRVSEDLSKGKKSFGGYGWIYQSRKIGRQELYDIKYVSSSATKMEYNVPVSRITVLTEPHQESQLSLNGNRRSTRLQQGTDKLPPKQLKKSPNAQFERLSDRLIHGARYNKSRGWRKKELGFEGRPRGDHHMSLSMAVDYRELREHLSKPNVKMAGLTQKYLALLQRRS